MYKITLAVLSIAFVALSVIVVYLIKENSTEYMEANQLQYVSSAGVSVETMEQAYILQMLNSNSIIDDIKMIDLEGNEILLSKILNNNYLLFIRLSEFNCNECVTYVLNKVRRLSIQGKYSDNIVILATYSEVRDLKILLKELRITFPVYLIDRLNIPCEKVNYPYCFVCNNLLIANQVFVPDKSSVKMTNLYFDLLNMRYFESKSTK